ncbi:hypothetical protein V6S75_23230 [Burkholderia pseudomallei]|uniref:hypothetical protein n=1 Tax=Burkholderia pseudomallei TaxID=28450 RepID=UPI001AD69156|nr:hypothetical protein [Burkholderia pseudomallei]MBO7768639.1 hypothetical protein [Burkholderia pseudomallei]MBO7824795.1 hypothetical protein [Burkholderia pseudomallei]MBO7881062.1 hypothetical protein [Burkholderia pseudomallei]
MAIDWDAVPYYVVLLSEHQQYTLNRERRVIGSPSDDLIDFAKKTAKPFPVDDRLWRPFADDLGLSPVERERFCCYQVAKGGESEDELQRLIKM